MKQKLQYLFITTNEGGPMEVEAYVSEGIVKAFQIRRRPTFVGAKIKVYLITNYLNIRYL
jgi:hypothetical protein